MSFIAICDLSYISTDVDYTDIYGSKSISVKKFEIFLKKTKNPKIIEKPIIVVEAVSILFVVVLMVLDCFMWVVGSGCWGVCRWAVWFMVGLWLGYAVACELVTMVCPNRKVT